MPRNPENRGTCAYCGEVLGERMNPLYVGVICELPPCCLHGMEAYDILSLIQ